jgi:hypothetical protein
VEGQRVRCNKCKREVSRVEGKNAHEERDGNRVVGVWHAKCWYVLQKEKRIGGRYYESSPTAYDMRQGAGRRTKDDVGAGEQGFTDWRDPVEVDVADVAELLEAQEEVESEERVGGDG